MSQSKTQIKSTHPLPAYNYRVTVQGDGDSPPVGFSEVSGLSLEYEPVFYKHGLSFMGGTKIIPGMRQPIRVTLKKGVVRDGSYLYTWIYDAYSDPSKSEKRDIVIDLCDETGSSVIRWKVLGALPTKLTLPTFDANTNEVAIESLELAAQDMQVDSVAS